jgi:hypothetical protein
MTQLHVPTTATAAPDLGAFDRAPTVASLLRQREGDERLFTVVLWMSFPFFLAFAASARLMQGGGGGERRASVFTVAAEAARSTIAIAFNQ